MPAHKKLGTLRWLSCIAAFALVLIGGDVQAQVEGSLVGSEDAALPGSSPERSEKLSFSVGLSTAGVSLEAAYRFRPKWAVRGIVGGAITVFGDGKLAGVDYDWRVRLGGSALLADYYPFEKGLRLSGGLAFPNANVTARAQGDLTVGDTEYSGARLNGKVRPAKDVLPMVSIGYVQPLFRQLSLTGDIGLIFTDGFVADFDTNGGSAVDADDLALEKAQFRDKAWDIFPFISLAFSYRF